LNDVFKFICVCFMAGIYGQITHAKWWGIPIVVGIGVMLLDLWLHPPKTWLDVMVERQLKDALEQEERWKGNYD